MASKRLIKSDKVSIHNRVLEAAAKERMEKLMIRENQVAKAVYASVLEGEGKQVQSLPNGFFDTRDHIDVKVCKNNLDVERQRNSQAYWRVALTPGYKDETLRVQGSHGYGPGSMEIGEGVRMPHKYCYGDVYLNMNKGLGAEVMALLEEQKKLSNDLTKLSETVLAALASCTTVKKLIENYPELKPYAPSEVADTPLAIAHGRIESLISCTKKSTCEEKETKKGPAKKGVIKL